jgi:5'-deoxynucleotidase YfbR-like HD superfamily hydrolase
MNPRELYQTFADSEYGQNLEQRTRFDVFKPDWVDTPTWTGLLGNDVNNLYHMPHTYDITRDFCREGRESDYTTDLLLTTAITHDWGEAKIGDIPLPDKTKADDALEQWAYLDIAKDLLGKQAGSELTQTVWSVLDHADEERGDKFRAIEYIGYCTTALRAGRVAVGIAHGFIPLDVSRKDRAELIGGLKTLESEVTQNNFPTLTEYAKKYTHIQEVLKGKLYV